MDQTLNEVKECITKYRYKDIVPAVNKALSEGYSAERILDEGMIAGMNEIGEGFRNNTIYMPQMLVAAKTMQAGLDVLNPKLAGPGEGGDRGKAIIGSVMGDVHDIGKNLVTVMLQGSGMDCIDLGADVPPEAFVSALDGNPDTRIIACSSSMTPTREALRETVTRLNVRDDRKDFAVFVGGATMDQMFSDEIGADIYTREAATAADRAKSLLGGCPMSKLSEESRKAALEEMKTVENEVRREESTGKDLRHMMPPAIRALRDAGEYDRPRMTIWENLQEWLKHDQGVPDAFLNQYFFDVLFDPVMANSRNLKDEFIEPQPQYVDGWGVTHLIPPGSAGSHPSEDPDLLVIKDITRWREQVREQPTTEMPEEAWAMSDQQAKAAREAGRPIAIPMFPGLFERTHFLMGMNAALTAYYEHPDEMHELIDWIADWECRALDATMGRYHAEILFHHDDWGTAINSFLDPETHREFFLKPYKRVFDHFRELGGKVVVHHSDSYAANLVPIQIEMGADIWQGPVSENNIPELIDKYGDRFIFMGGIDNAIIDRPGFTDEGVEAFVRQRIEQNGCRSYIPCQTRGLGLSIVPGVYDSISKAIDKISHERFD